MIDRPVEGLIIESKSADGRRKARRDPAAGADAKGAERRDRAEDVVDRLVAILGVVNFLACSEEDRVEIGEGGERSL